MEAILLGSLEASLPVPVLEEMEPMEAILPGSLEATLPVPVLEEMEPTEAILPGSQMEALEAILPGSQEVSLPIPALEESLPDLFDIATPEAHDLSSNDGAEEDPVSRAFLMEELEAYYDSYVHVPEFMALLGNSDKATFMTWFGSLSMEKLSTFLGFDHDDLPSLQSTDEGMRSVLLKRAARADGVS